MSVHPDWGKDESLVSLKTVLKWEIQHLLQRLADVGEEAFLFTVSVKDGGTTEMGSPRGQVFLSMSDLQNIKSQFQSYCQGYSETVVEQMEIYRDLSSGQLSLGPRTSVESDHRRKRRKKIYLQQPKIPRVDVDQHSVIKLELSSDDNSRGHCLNQGLEQEGHLPESTAETESGPVRSRRKRTPKKVLQNDTSGEDDNEEKFIIPDNSETSEHFDYQSENFEMTGSTYEDFYVKKSQSLDQISDNQSENLELTGHCDDFSVNTFPNNQEEDLNVSIDMPSGSQSTVHPLEAESHELAVLLRKTKDTVAKKTKNSARKSMKLNTSSCFETDVQCSFLAEKSMPVFPDAGSSRKATSFYANSGGVANNVGGDDVCFPMTTFGDDGHMRIVKGKSEDGEDNLVLNSENSLLRARLSKSAENSPKLDKQPLENNAFYTPPRKKGFKPVPHDENPAETALLDASKLGVGRYKCLMCSQTTRDRHDLKRHLRTHTKEKPYQCSLCGKRFTRKWDLENHLARHNKTEQDETNVKVSKQSTKAIDAANTEVLTYEKLVSKLLLERKISVKGNDGTETAEGDNGIIGANENFDNSRSIFDNLSQGNSESTPDLLSEWSGKSIKAEKTDLNEGVSSVSQNNIENIETSFDIEGNHSKLEQSETESVTNEAVIDNLVVKFMNDTLSSVITERGNDIGCEEGREVKSEPGSDINS